MADNKQARTDKLGQHANLDTLMNLSSLWDYFYSFKDPVISQKSTVKTAHKN